MAKTQKKFFLISTLVLSGVFLIFFLIIFFSLYLKIQFVLLLLLWLVLALALAAAVTYAYTLTSSAISDAMTTLRRMSRAENLSNPLIMRLSTEAPGTYHHSLNVSNLAQRAAKIVGADSLLVRVASYYHDIGKLSDPKVFIENQSQTEISHEENSEWIRSNAKKIIAHVESGLKIARETGLAEEIADIIKEHHGTTKALYFYEKAKEKGLKIKKTDFSYPGPIPQSRESAIVMLADCVEASARSRKELNRDEIFQISGNIIEEKLKEGQLKRSALSDSDLILIRDSFVETLMNIYHQRINYADNANDPTHK